MDHDKQRTLAQGVELAGIGLHSGAAVSARLLPAEAGSGVRIRRRDLPGRPEFPATIDCVRPDALLRQTTLAAPGRPDAAVGTIEHLLAALRGMDIDNCLIEIDAAEAPVDDGSARAITTLIAQAGAVEQNADRQPLRLSQPVALTDGEREIVAIPSDRLRLTFFLHYPGTMIGLQAQSIAITPESFAAEIAPARTFCLRAEIEGLRAHGLARGGSFDNALVVDGDHLLNPDPTLRFPDEFVRHKILDLLGDLALLGRPLQAHVLAVKTGHATHAAFTRQLKGMMDHGEL